MILKNKLTRESVEINYSEFARETIIKQFESVGYKIPTQNSYAIPDISTNFDYTNSNKVDDLRKMLGGISKRLAYRLLAEQEIRSVRVGRTYKIPKLCVIEYLLGEEMCHINLS